MIWSPTLPRMATRLLPSSLGPTQSNVLESAGSPTAVNASLGNLYDRFRPEFTSSVVDGLSRGLVDGQLPFDAIFAFASIHDQVDPVLRQVHEALSPDGLS
jgi:hypothetical protein